MRSELCRSEAMGDFKCYLRNPALILIESRAKGNDQLNGHASAVIM